MLQRPHVVFVIENAEDLVRSDKGCSKVEKQERKPALRKYSGSPSSSLLLLLWLLAPPLDAITPLFFRACGFFFLPPPQLARVDRERRERLPRRPAATTGPNICPLAIALSSLPAL